MKYVLALFLCPSNQIQLWSFKGKKILEGCLDLIPPPLPSVKIQIVGENYTSTINYVCSCKQKKNMRGNLLKYFLL